MYGLPMSDLFQVIFAVGQKGEPMSDLISRQAAIDAFLTELTKRERKNLLHTWSTVEVKYFVVDMLEKLPSAQPEQRWIPVSKRMPEPRIDVWCNSDMGQMVGYYDEYAETWYGRDYLELIVTAWMPLPEPYKAESEEHHD